MNRAFVLLPLVVAVAGCGDPAPSTKLAPDVPAPDTSKFTPEEIKQAKERDASPPR